MAPDPRRPPLQEHEGVPPSREREVGRSSREYDDDRQPSREYEREPPPPGNEARWPSREYEGGRPPPEFLDRQPSREYDPVRHARDEYEAGRQGRAQEVGRREQEYGRPPPQSYEAGVRPRSRGRDDFDDKHDRGKERANIERERMHKLREHDGVEDEEEYKDSGRATTTANPASGAFNGWANAALYYHAIHRLPPLSVSTVCKKA